MADIIKIGPFLVKVSRLWLAVGLILGYLVMNIRQKKMPETNLVDEIINGALLWLLIWKFSLIIFSPASVIQQPLQLIYFSGGYRGIWLASLSGIGYLSYRARKRQLSLWSLVELLVWGLGTVNVVNNLGKLWISPSEWAFSCGQIVLSIIILLWLHLKNTDFSELKYEFFLWVGIGQIFIHFFKTLNPALFMGLSQPQLIFFCLALCGLIGQWVKRNPNRR